MRTNNQSNRLIKWGVIAGDFVVLNILLYFLQDDIDSLGRWSEYLENMYWLICNTALLFSELRFSTIIHQRRVGADVILKRTTTLVLTQTLLAYLMLRIVHFEARIGWQLLAQGIILLLVFTVVRLVERWLLKKLRESGYNTRTATLVGSDKELLKVYDRLMGNPTLGYKVVGYYGDLPGLPRTGSYADFVAQLDSPGSLQMGDELYLCVSRRERDVIERTSRLCDQKVVWFYYVPLSDELLNLQTVILDDMEVLTHYTSPLEEPLNRLVKRLSDIVLAVVFLLLTALLFPFICLIIKLQSPGPVFFRQRRTGLHGRDFYCYKFRSMHVNSEADSQQATRDDPRKFPFGDFMRKTNIDELPQFWNVLRGNMSIVGPRPHMLSHTEQYSQLIDKYMVRHFVKPGVTGWAQVTGFRGETRELWQMEGRVERDIWYIQHWSIWLDFRIIWMTLKSIFVRDEHAY